MLKNVSVLLACSFCLFVSGNAYSRPDLIVGDVSVDPNTLSPGDSFELSVTVKNQGSAVFSTRTDLQYYRSTNSRITTGDTEVGTLGRPVGQWAAVFIHIDLTAPSRAGTYYYGACIASQ